MELNDLTSSDYLYTFCALYEVIHSVIQILLILMTINIFSLYFMNVP